MLALDLQQVIQGCVRNERVSQERLYKEYYVPLFCMCRRFFENDHEAIESVNDGMMKVFGHIADYRPEKGQFFNWVYTIVRHTAIDKVRASMRPSILSGPYDTGEGVPETAADHNPIAALERKDLYILLDQLNPGTRVICNLYYIEGYSVKEIAENVGLTAGTIKWHLSESRKKLKSVLESHFNR
jgi:RNA polymerase sigma-70 factor (ECF subfamily)